MGDGTLDGVCLVTPALGNCTCWCEPVISTLVRRGHPYFRSRQWREMSAGLMKHSAQPFPHRRSFRKRLPSSTQTHPDLVGKAGSPHSHDLQAATWDTRTRTTVEFSCPPRCNSGTRATPVYPYLPLAPLRYHKFLLEEVNQVTQDSEVPCDLASLRVKSSMW